VGVGGGTPLTHYLVTLIHIYALYIYTPLPFIKVICTIDMDYD